VFNWKGGPVCRSKKEERKKRKDQKKEKAKFIIKIASLY